MLRWFSRGRSVPLTHHDPNIPDGSRLHQAKLTAWALATGQRPSTEDRSYRLPRRHRGMLHDLPQPETPELAPMPVVRVFVDLIESMLRCRGFAAASEATLSGDPKTPVGQMAPVTYIDRSDAGESKVSAQSGADRRTPKSRAA